MKNDCTYSKTCVKRPLSKIDKTKILMTNGSLMKVKSIIFGLLESGRFYIGFALSTKFLLTDSYINLYVYVFFRVGSQDVTKCWISTRTKFMREKSSQNTEYQNHTSDKR